MTIEEASQQITDLTSKVDDQTQQLGKIHDEVQALIDAAQGVELPQEFADKLTALKASVDASVQATQAVDDQNPDAPTEPETPAA